MTEQLTWWWPASREEYVCVSKLSPLSLVVLSRLQPVGCFYPTQGGASFLH